MVRWCWFINEVARAEEVGRVRNEPAPSLATAVTCEDVLLMKITIDTLTSGAARFTEIKRFAREHLGITSHDPLYKVLGRLCGYGLVRFRRGSGCGLSDYDCNVSRTGCRIVAILPTTVGLILASTTSFALYTYLDMYTRYVRGEFDRSDSRVAELILNSIINLFNMGQFNPSTNGSDKALAQEMYAAAVNAALSLGDGLKLLMGLAGTFGLDTPASTFSFRDVVFSGHAKRLLRFFLADLADVALSHGFKPTIVNALINDLLNDRVENIRSNRDYWGLINAVAMVRTQRRQGPLQVLLQ